MTIDELEAFFSSQQLPDTIQVNRAVRISDPKLFISTNLIRARLLGTSPLFGTSYKDLLALKDTLATEAK